MRDPRPLTLLAVVLALTYGAVLTGCARSGPRGDPAIRALQAEARPIGHGRRFHQPARGRVPGSCERRLGPRTAVHVELFAQNRVVLLPAGIGVRGPVRYAEGRILAARCDGSLVTLDPTGVVLVRARSHLTLRALFRAWGQPLSRTRLAAFRAPAGGHVHAFVDGRPRPGDPRAIPLTPDAEIVLEVGPHVRPHTSYTFPPGT